MMISLLKSVIMNPGQLLSVSVKPSCRSLTHLKCIAYIVPKKFARCRNNKNGETMIQAKRDLDFLKFPCGAAVLVELKYKDILFQVGVV